MFTEIVKGAEVAAKASTGDTVAVIQFCITVICLVFGWLGVLSTSLVFIGVAISKIKERRATDLKQVYATCEPKYQTLAKVEEKCESLKDSIGKLEKDYAVIDRDLASLGERIGSIEGTIGEMWPEIQSQGKALSRIEGLLTGGKEVR